MSDKLDVQFFPSIGSACGPGASACACGPSCGPEEVAADPNAVVAERAEQVRQRFGDRVEVRVADYSSPQDVERVISTLNTALERSGAAFTVSQASLPTLLETVAPIVTVGDQVAFSRGLPPLERLQEAIDDALATASA